MSATKLIRMKPDSFWEEPFRRRLKRIIGLINCLIIVVNTVCAIHYFRSRPKPVSRENPWLNYDPARPVSDIKELDYDRRWIIYRDEEPKREIREFQREPDCRMYQEPANCYEDYYEELYEYFHD